LHLLASIVMANQVNDGILRAALSATDAMRLTDRELLAQFVAGDQTAFASIVKRHTGLVFGVCQRVLPTLQDAEDASQATFLVLARKARRNRWQPSIANWLFTTARRIASETNRSAARRMKRESLAVPPVPISALDQMTGREAFTALDEELDKLPAIYREPLVLCYLQGLTRDQAAILLQVPFATLKGQLDRGRRKLADALSRRGIDIGACLIAVAGVTSAGASSLKLVESILATVGGSPSSSVAVIARGIAMNGFALNAKLLALASVTVVVTGFLLALMQIEASPQRPAIEPTKQPAIKDNAKSNEPTAEPPAEKATAALSISGRVLDANSGKPIAKCRVIPASSMFDPDLDQVTWQSQDMKEFSDGRFLYQEERPWEHTLLRIEADGYRPGLTRAVKKSEKSVEFDVKLVRDFFAGVVLLPNGQPAAKAQVAIASWTNEVNVQLGKLSYRGHAERLRKVVETDMQGRFMVPAEIDLSVMVVAHEFGYAEMTTVLPHSAEKPPDVKQPNDARPQNNQALKITLQEWGRVEGRILGTSKPVVGAKFWVYQSRSDNVHVWANQNVESNPDGRFVVERIPPGDGGICQRYADNSNGKGSHSISGLLVRFDVPPGKTTTLQLGSPGRTVVGKLAVPEGFPHKLDWGKVNVNVHLEFPRNWQDKLSLQSWSKFQESEEGQLYGRTNVKPAADGSFRLEDLPAAKYELDVVADGQAVIGDQKPSGEIGRGTKEFSVPAIASPNASTPIDLGTIKIMNVSVAQGGPDTELKKFHGEWYAVFGEYQGKRTVTKTEKDSVFLVTGDKLLNKLDGKDDGEATITVDPTQNPKTIDITLKEKDADGGFVGIYEFQADGTLRLALSARGDGRPTSFKTTSTSAHRLFELKRVDRPH
jgi:RNA polymerase sigma factor (sigma-70 family)